MKRNRIKLNESTLKNIIAESIKKILNERDCCFKDCGEIIISPYEDFCENEDEEDVLKECGIKPEYKVICSVTRIHEDPVMYDRNGEGYPGYDGTEDFGIDKDGGFENDMERVKSVNPALYEKIMAQYLDMENTYLYDSIKWESDGYCW